MMAFFRHAGRSTMYLRLAILAVVLVALVALLVRTTITGLLAQQSGGVARPTRTIPNTDVNPYGANFFLTREVEDWKMDKTLQMASEAGIGWVKQHVPWEELEPLRKGEYLQPGTNTDTWAKYDRIVSACEKYGLRMIARLDRPPDWTRQDNTYKERPPDDLEDYGDFVYAFARRYAGRVDYIQVWNEPNIFPEWGNRPVDPAGYVELLKVAYRRAKEANPNVYVLSAPLALTLGQPHPEPGKWISMSDLQFLDETYRAGAAAYFDVYAANAFGFEFPPEDPPDAGKLNFQRVVLHRDIMVRYDDRAKPVWFNEYGWNAAPESFAAERLIWRRVTEQQQAEYTLRGIQLARKEWPWAGVFNIWYFRQVGNITSDRADYYFRMVDVDFTPRLLYFAVQDVNRREATPGPGRYEETNPNVLRYGRWRHVIDIAASDQALIVSDLPGESLAFTFQGAGVDLITRRGPDAGQLLVSLDGRPVSGLPTTPEGLSYIDLYRPEVEAQARIPLVRLGTSGRHAVRITVAEAKHPEATGGLCALDAFDVVLAVPGRFPWLPVLGLLLAIGLNVWLLWKTWSRLRWMPSGR
jgi:hypothetical protein